MHYYTHWAFIVVCLNFFSIWLASIVINKINSYRHKQQLQTTQPNRTEALDGLRGVLSLSVLSAHFCLAYVWQTTGTWQGSDTIVIANLGGTSVAMFFLITGYLFFSKIMQPNVNWTKLYLNRLKRIYPLYLFAFCIVAAITFYNIPVNAQNWHEYLSWIKKWLLFRGWNFQDFESTIVLAGAQWTLLYEWAFYFSLPLMYMLWHRKWIKPIAWWGGNFIYLFN